MTGSIELALANLAERDRLRGENVTLRNGAVRVDAEKAAAHTPQLARSL